MFSFDSFSQVPFSSLPGSGGESGTIGLAQGIATVFGFSSSTVTEFYAILRGMTNAPVATAATMANNAIAFLESFI